VNNQCSKFFELVGHYINSEEEEEAEEKICARGR
jgi:hypothetical protein